MNSKQPTQLIVGIAIAFAVPWILLVLVPYIQHSNLEPIPYEEDVEGGYQEYPERAFYRVGSSDYGREIYAAEGCAYCHTQMIRPTYAGPDMWRPGWGGRDQETARETRPRDYVLEDVALLGYQRIGQDLSNVGHRITTRELMHKHLSDPKSIDPNSGMPAYLHLYRESPYEEGKLIPTSRAEALVDYLLSLKKDQPLPARKS